MAEHKSAQIFEAIKDEHMSSREGTPQAKNGPTDVSFTDDGGGGGALHSYSLFLIFKQFRKNNQHKELIEFLIEKYPANVKNKTFNFVNTNHLFHSLYAYIPAITNVEKERKQIRLSEECIRKLFSSTMNDFKLYAELFNMIQVNRMREECPCQLLLQRREEIKAYVATINEKKFDNKPPKLKKETIDSIMYKYSLNWKNLLLKRKVSTGNNGIGSNDAGSANNNDSGVNISETVIKKKRKIKKRTILTDDYIYVDGVTEADKLDAINGMSLRMCKHKWVVAEKQLRAGDEAVSFIRYCQLCAQIS
ncbi:late expression factor 5 [Orgyia leucostigma nucleopolyhedrovirus]|uniref:Late expression factor 5 n=1 Tax=Orgyia leucostigma nucleopolyhedrovirus TaxID=490711 RepID=B0FDV4_9ABAC|nr:late expression factor 5 [Orgyia leucostigma nucleopolyhedrovirus]ABY65812.1 late expression factor 5 [Orgyia leucostigma nucleopolyhedrovirus]